MPEETTSRWMALAAKAAQERDPARLLRLVRELNRLLNDRNEKTKRTFDNWRKVS